MIRPKCFFHTYLLSKHEGYETVFFVNSITEVIIDPKVVNNALFLNTFLHQKFIDSIYFALKEGVTSLRAERTLRKRGGGGVETSSSQSPVRIATFISRTTLTKATVVQTLHEKTDRSRKTFHIPLLGRFMVIRHRCVTSFDQYHRNRFVLSNDSSYHIAKRRLTLSMNSFHMYHHSDHLPEIDTPFGFDTFVCASSSGWIFFTMTIYIVSGGGNCVKSFLMNSKFQLFFLYFQSDFFIGSCLIS